MSDTNSVPTHIGFIMDGNRRWAKARGLPPMEGHRNGVEVLKRVVRHCFNNGVKFVSAYVFSTENWKRAEEEVSFLMGLVVRVVERELDAFHKDGVRIVILGSRDKLPAKVLKSIETTEEKTKNNTKGTVALCLNYGGISELTDMVKKITASGVSPSEITDEVIMANLYHPEVPPIDLVVRSSGEQRLSGYMLARSAYSEFKFFDKHWPDFTEKDIDEALSDYASRQRRFGS